MAHSIKVSLAACQGCVNCIKSCPTEAIRVIDGTISILKDLCIDCGECLRACQKKALGLDDDDWDLIRAHGSVVALADPTFYAQFGSFWHPELAKKAMEGMGIELLTDVAEDAFDLSAYATAHIIEETNRDQLPIISTYCPSVVRLIQLQYPELINRIMPVENALDIEADLWRKRTKSYAPLTLMAPCPAKITLVRDPIGREPSAIQHVVSIRKVVRSMMAGGIKGPNIGESHGYRGRSSLWAVRGGESKHVSEFSKNLKFRPITVLAVSGLRNTMDLLQELGLGRLSGVDFVEARICDLGCFGGVATPESRFLANLRNRNPEVIWELAPEKTEELDGIYKSGKVWKIRGAIPSKQRLPLSDDLNEAMAKLNQMKSIYAVLPHIDCGACGRPSCKAMAEDIVRDQGDVTDCIFKLREGISSLANQILSLSSLQPQTIKKRR